jgi:hypothetical protein
VEHLAVVHAHPSEDTRTKMEALFAARDALFSVAAPAAHAGRVAQFRSPVIAARIATTRRTLRAQVADLFATELTLAPAGALDILDDATSFEAWELRSTRSARARNTAQRLLLTTLVSLLTKEST